MLAALTTIAQDYSYYTTYSSNSHSGFGGVPIVLVLGGLVLGIFTLIAMWKLFVKAHQPGWAAIVPIYNTLVLLKIVGRPWWWFLLMLVSFVPFVGWIVSLAVTIIVMNDLSKSFGKSTGTTVLLLLLPFVGIPYLAFGDATYHGPSATGFGAGTGTGGTGHTTGTPPSAVPPTIPPAA